MTTITISIGGALCWAAGRSPRPAEGRLDRLARIADRADRRASRRMEAVALVDPNAADWYQARRLVQRLSRMANPCEHQRMGYGTCTHPRDVEVVECDACGEVYAESHHHQNPTGRASAHCDEHGEYHPTCSEVYICDDCSQSYCDIHDCEAPHGPDIPFTSVEDYREWRGKPTARARGRRLVGVELEAENGHSLEMPYNRGYGVTEDGSLDDGVEIQTPPASGDELERMLRDAIDALQDGGWDVDSGHCGTHIHLDMRDKVADLTYQARLYATFYAIEDVLYGLNPGRQDNYYCRPLHKTFFDGLRAAAGRRGIARFPYAYHGIFYDYGTPRGKQNLERHQQTHYHDSRYHGINFHAIPSHGTLEVRIHDGTLDADRLLPWIDLLQSVVATVDTRWCGYKRLERIHDEANPTRKVALMIDTFRPTPAVRKYLRAHFTRSDSLPEVA